MSELNLPLEIENNLLRLLAIDDELATETAAMKKIESRVTIELTGAKDVKTGKLILTNDKQRDAAVAETLGGDEEFLRRYGKRERLARERGEVQAALERIRIDVKYDLQRRAGVLLEREAENQRRAFELADAIWRARQAPDAFSPARVKAAVSGLPASGAPVVGPGPAPAPEFFRGELRVIQDREAGEADDAVDIPF